MIVHFVSYSNYVSVYIFVSHFLSAHLHELTQFIVFIAFVLRLLWKRIYSNQLLYHETTESFCIACVTTFDITSNVTLRLIFGAVVLQLLWRWFNIKTETSNVADYPTIKFPWIPYLFISLCLHTVGFISIFSYIYLHFR